MNFKKVCMGAFIMLGVVVSPISLLANTQGLSTSDIVIEMNKERLARGLGALRIDSNLTNAAQSRSAFLADQGRIFHVSSPAGTPWPELWNAGYKYVNAGENLALGLESPRELRARWMESPSHRDNIVSSIYEDVGVGVTTAYHPEAKRLVSYVVVYFGKKRPEAVALSSSAVQTSSVPRVADARKSVQSTVVSSQSIPLVLPSTHSISSSENEEKIRLLTQLIALLESYLASMKLASSLR